MARAKTPPAPVDPEPADDLPPEDEILVELERLERLDKLDAESILALAADPASPLHDKFTWNDDEAAHRWRLWQARALMARYRRYTVSQTTGGTVAYRRFTHVPTLGRSIDTDQAVAGFRDELVERYRRDVRSMIVRYRRLGEDTLAEIFTESLAT